MVCCISVMASVRSCPLSTDIDVIENRGNSPTQAPRHVDSLWVDYLFDSAALYAIHKPHLPQGEVTVYRGISGEQFHGRKAS